MLKAKFTSAAGIRCAFCSLSLPVVHSVIPCTRNYRVSASACICLVHHLFVL